MDVHNGENACKNKLSKFSWKLWPSVSPLRQSLLYTAVTWEFQEVRGYRMTVSDLRGSKDVHPQVNFFPISCSFRGGGGWNGQNNRFVSHLSGHKCEKIWQREHYVMFLGSTRLVKHWTNSCLIVSELDLWLRCTKTTDGNLCRWHRWGRTTLYRHCTGR